MDCNAPAVVVDVAEAGSDTRDARGNGLPGSQWQQGSPSSRPLDWPSPSHAECGIMKCGPCRVDDAFGLPERDQAEMLHRDVCVAVCQHDRALLSIAVLSGTARLQPRIIDHAGTIGSANCAPKALSAPPPFGLTCAGVKRPGMLTPGKGQAARPGHASASGNALTVRDISPEDFVSRAPWRQQHRPQNDSDTGCFRHA